MRRITSTNMNGPSEGRVGRYGFNWGLGHGVYVGVRFRENIQRGSDFDYSIGCGVVAAQPGCRWG